MFDCRGMDGKIRARCFSRRFFHMQGTIREWTEEKLEGGSSQILETSDLRAVRSKFVTVALKMKIFFHENYIVRPI